MKNFNNNNRFFRSFLVTILLTICSTLAFATFDNDPTPQEEPSQIEQEIIIAPVGFDKVLSLILFDVESTQVEVEITQEHTGFAFTTTLRVMDSEVLELDLADFEGGTYTLSLSAGDYSETQTVIFP